MRVDNTPFPLSEIPIQVILTYKNTNDIAKRPVVVTVPPPLVSTPQMSFTVNDSSDLVQAGMRKTFNLVILLTKLKANLQIEVSYE